MIELTLTPAQGDWLEASWTDVTQAPDVVTPAVPEKTITLPQQEISPGVFDTVLRTQVLPGIPEVVTPGAITRTDLKHTSYHPTQLDLLQADAELMGTPLDKHADIDYAVSPKGAGVLRFGTHSALAAETVTGYITIKDSAGTVRKLAVVS